MAALLAIRPQQIFHNFCSFFTCHSEKKVENHPILSQDYARRWLDAKLSKEQLLADPYCAKRIVQLNLHHVFRTWEGVIRQNPLDRQIELRVDGVWQKALPFLKGIRAKWEGWESIKKAGEFWCCTGFGFEKRRLSDWTHLRECAKLSSEQFAYAKQMAAKLPSPFETGEKNCILEIISGEAVKNDYYSLLNGIKDIYASPQHPFIHCIDEEGRVKGNGFWPSEQFKFWKFFFTFPGRFRSPDSYLCVPFHKRVVTRIAISRKQHDELVAVMERYQKEGKRFSVRHNCTAFVSDILHRVGFAVDSRIQIVDFIGRCFPLVVQKICSPLVYIANKIRAVAHYFFIPLQKPLETIVNKMQETFRKIIGKPTLISPDQVPFLGSNPDNFLRYPLPKRILEWQKKQESSATYPKHSSFYDLYRTSKA